MSKPEYAASDATPQKGVASRLHRTLLEAISDGQYLPGQRLVEADLCARYGASRNIVREVLQRLSWEGVVELAHAKGATVRVYSPEQLRETLEMSEVLLGLGARSAAEKIHMPDAASALQQAMSKLDDMRSSLDDRGFVRARDEVVITLLKIGRNEELLRLMPLVRMHVIRAQYNLVSLYRAGISDLRRVIEAVLAGDASQAEKLARRHVRRLRDKFELRLKVRG